MDPPLDKLTGSGGVINGPGDDDEATVDEFADKRAGEQGVAAGDAGGPPIPVSH